MEAEWKAAQTIWSSDGPHLTAQAPGLTHPATALHCFDSRPLQPAITTGQSSSSTFRASGPQQAGPYRVRQLSYQQWRLQVDHLLQLAASLGVALKRGLFSGSHRGCGSPSGSTPHSSDRRMTVRVMATARAHLVIQIPFLSGEL